MLRTWVSGNTPVSAALHEDDASREGPDGVVIGQMKTNPVLRTNAAASCFVQFGFCHVVTSLPTNSSPSVWASCLVAKLYTEESRSFLISIHVPSIAIGAIGVLPHMDSVRRDFFALKDTMRRSPSEFHSGTTRAFRTGSRSFVNVFSLSALTPPLPRSPGRSSGPARASARLRPRLRPCAPHSPRPDRARPWRRRSNALRDGRYRGR